MTTRITTAYDIPLTDADLAAIGQICAIQGQIEYLMQQIVQRLLQTNHAATTAIMTSTNSFPRISEVWLSVVRDKCKEPHLVGIAEEAFKRMTSLTQGRNHFVHAFYAQSGGNGGFGLTRGSANSDRFLEHLAKLDTIVAVRTRDRKMRSKGGIVGVRDDAAKISCALAHVLHELTRPPEWKAQAIAPSPWHGTFW